MLRSFSRSSAEQRDLYRAAINMLDCVKDTLSIRSIRNELGTERTIRLQRLAQGARILITDGKEIKTVEPRRHTAANGLFFMPISTTTGVNHAVKITHDGDALHLPVGKIAERGDAMHLTFEGIPDTSIICWPTESLTTEKEIAAVGIHELVHADQFHASRPLYRNESPAQEKTRHEAEAYDAQIVVTNNLNDGIFTSVINANRNNTDIHSLTCTGKAAAIAYGSMLTLNGLAAVVRNAAHDYLANGVTLPSHQLANEYAQLQLLH